MFKTRLILLVSFGIFVVISAQDKELPDLTLLSQYNNNGKYDLTCVAGNNIRDSAITFIINPTTKKLKEYKKVSEYTNLSKSMQGDFDCNFNTDSSCISHWTNSNNYKIKTILEQNIAPITDRKWEIFEILKTMEGTTIIKKIEPNQMIHISVRGSNNLNMILFDDFPENNMKNNGYWIHIIEKTKIDVKKCYDVNKNPESFKSNDCDLLENTQTIPNNSLKMNEWNHISIRIENNYFTIVDSMMKTIFSSYDPNGPLTIKSVLFYSTEYTEWKLHNLNHYHLSLNTEHRNFQQIGPSFEALLTGTMCISLSIATCDTCIFNVNFDKISTNSDIHANADMMNEEKGVWKYIEFSKHVIANEKYGFYFQNVNNGNSNAYWLIRDIRECHENEARKITLTNINDANRRDLISCQALAYPEMSVKTVQKSSEINQFCNDSSKIGHNCDISCETLFNDNNNNYCNKCLICKRNQENRGLICVCSAGYTGKNCEEACSPGYYGYNCAHKCGRCKDYLDCGKSTGQCKGACEKGYGYMPTCNTLLYPRLKYPPKLIYSTLREIKIRFENIETDGEEIPTHYRIQFTPDKIWNNLIDSRQFNSLNMSDEIIDKLVANTNYTFRAVLSSNNKDFYEGEEIPKLTARTECINYPLNEPKIKNISIMKKSTYVKFTWTSICECNCQIYLTKLNGNTNDKISTTFSTIVDEKTLDNLLPYTKYNIEISCSNLVVLNQTIRTDPDVPSPVRNLAVYSKDESYLSLRWRTPDPLNGVLELYLITFSAYSIKLEKPEYCHLWEDYICYNLTDLNTSKYNVYVQAKNNNVTTLSSYETLTVSTKAEASEPPMNLTAKWNEIDTLILNWYHPNKTNGYLISFKIIIEQLKTDLINVTFPKKTLEFRINKPNKTYEYEVTIDIPFSSFYNISVYGFNKIDGELSSINVHTPPALPKLEGHVSTNSNKNSNLTQIITIPSADNTTVSSTSLMVVVICDPNANRITENVDSFKMEISTKLNCKGATRIPAVFQANTSPREFIVGNDVVPEQKLDSFPNELNNGELKQTESVYLVLVNDYNGKRRYNEYTIIDVPTLDSPSVNYILIIGLCVLFILIPVIIWIVYIYLKKHKRNTKIGESIDMSLTDLRPPLSFTAKWLQKSHNTDPQDDGTKRSLLGKLRKKDELQSSIVPLNQLSEYVKNSLSTGKLEKQHASFKKGPNKPWDYGTRSENKFKNRYNNIAAYDDTRVVLEKLPGDPFSDYINASYIDGYQKKNAYIATQGPKISTINDFWRMIWQEKVEYIVMLANLTEAGKKKCEQYWPNIDESKTYINIEVTFIKSEIFADFQYRTFEVKCNNQTRQIQQLHFTSWPDHGVPVYPQSLVPFLKKILQISIENAPIVVHCSAGVGRTGTIILSDICLRMSAKEKAVDVLYYFKKIRDNRANMVDNFDQYKLVHIILLECLLSPNTSIQCDGNFKNYIEKIMKDNTIDMQMTYLLDTSWHYQKLKCNNYNEDKLKSKNRFSHIVPEYNRLYLDRYPVTDEFSDYINAVPVDGYHMKEQFIVTQTPLPNTIGDFWRMINQYEIQVIVSLNEINLNEKTSCIFWPAEKIKVVPFITISFHSSSANELYNLHKIEMTDSSEQDVKKSIVSIVQFKNWEPDQNVPESIEQFNQFLEEVQILSRQQKPIVITCFDGATASGLFVALSFIHEKVKLEQICDVCLAVQAVRQNRPQFIKNKIQFEFLYNSVLNYLTNFETYSNFEIVTKK